MNEKEALERMVPPGQRRRVWRGGVIQIWVTRACDKACFGCTQGSNLGGRPGMITLEQFHIACRSLRGYFGVVGIFGGNPAIHPQFEELCRIARSYFPQEQLGLWCNHPRGKGRIMRETFNPSVSNLNVHMDREAYDEFKRDWPESRPVGLDRDSRHSPPFVAMKDMDELQLPDGRIVPNTEENRWELISGCDINRCWSALVGVFRGQVRAWFCEIAAAQSMLHEHDPDYPDTGIPIDVEGLVDTTAENNQGYRTKSLWWKLPMESFAGQVRKHCHDCGIPLRGYGELAVGGKMEQVSPTHAAIYKPKVKNRLVQITTRREDLREQALSSTVTYLQNAKR